MLKNSSFLEEYSAQYLYKCLGVYFFLCTDMTEEYGYSALHNAIITRDLKAAHKLATSAAGCDLESRDSMGFTALHLATLQGNNKDLVEMLIQAGCNTNSRTKVSCLIIAEIDKVLLSVRCGLEARCL